MLLIYLLFLAVAYVCYRVGKALWVRSVGASWYLLPAIGAYLIALWLLITATVYTRGLATMLAGAVWGGIIVGRRLARPRRREETERQDE